jgi:rubrerythrin
MEKDLTTIQEYYAMYGKSPDMGNREISEVEKLLSEFEAHESQEREFLNEYRKIIEETKNPFIKFLLRLIVSDEEKHQAIVQAMVATLKGDLTWTKPEEAIRGLNDVGKGNDRLTKLTEGFVRLEREGIKEYKKMVKNSKGYYHGLFSLLLDSMIRDSEKHIAILEFLRRRLKSV